MTEPNIEKIPVDELTATIETALATCDSESIAGLPALAQTVQLARGLRALRNALSSRVVTEIFLPLQGSKLGFRTDKDREKEPGYDWLTVRDCLIEAMIRGARPVGNEFNIIAGNTYLTKEYFERKVETFPGLTDLIHEPGVPHMANGGALVPYRISWKLNGRSEILSFDAVKNESGEVFDQRIPVKVNNGMGADAILGKARRKVLARVYERLSGIKVPDGDVIDTVGEAVDRTEKQIASTSSAADALAEKHLAKAAAKKVREPGEEG